MKFFKPDVAEIRRGLKEINTSHKNNTDSFDPVSFSRKVEDLIKSEAHQRTQANKLRAKLSQTEKSLSFRLGRAIMWPARTVYSVRIIKSVVDMFYYMAFPSKKKILTNSSMTYGGLFKTPKRKKFYLGSRQTADLQDIKVAAVMDEFTYESFSPECNITQLTLANWKEQIDEFVPDILFIESAWRGVDGVWRESVSRNPDDILKVVRYCQDRNIPTVFWNKEDPAHTADFMPVASMCDFVFTTDADCVPVYRDILGHSRVYLLPFAAQPKIHNPIEVYDRQDKFNFAGSYYSKYKERSANFNSIATAVAEYKGLDIYDRNYGKDVGDKYRFPDNMQPFVRGSLAYSEIDRAYKGYNYSININTIKYSSTMFARRVFELLASNTITVSNFSEGIKNILGDLVVSSDDGEEVVERLKAITPNEEAVRAYRLIGLRTVLRYHTYDKRLIYLLGKVFEDFHDNRADPAVGVVASVSSKHEYEKIKRLFHDQDYENKHLILMSDSLDESYVLRDKRAKVIGKDGKGLKDVLTNLDYVAFFHPLDYYGPNYLLDFALATKYIDKPIITKASSYVLSTLDEVKLRDDGLQYRLVEGASVRRSFVKASFIKGVKLEQVVRGFLEGDVLKEESFSIDEFNYCMNGSSIDNNHKLKIIDGDTSINTGGQLNELYARAEEVAGDKSALILNKLLRAVRVRRTKAIHREL